MGVAHEPKGKFGPARAVLLSGECELLVHQRDFTPEMQREIGRAAIGTVKRDGINSVGARADIAGKIAQQVPADRNRPRPMPGLVLHLHGDEAATRLLAIEIPGPVAEPVAHIGRNVMFNLLRDRLDIGEMHERIIIRYMASIGTDGLARPRCTAGSGLVFVRHLSAGRRTADQEQPRHGSGVRRELVDLARRAPRSWIG